MMVLCNCIALYDYTPASVQFKEWFNYVEKWADWAQQPWDSIGIPGSRKLMLFKNGKKKLEKNNFLENYDDKLKQDDSYSIELLGGVSEPGTNDDWKTYTSVSKEESHRAVLCFSNDLAPFQADYIRSLIKDLLQFGNFKYGIAYQRDFDKGPSSYAGGVIETYGNIEIAPEERRQIAQWRNAYKAPDGRYRTGLLRDIYPFNVLIEAHLQEPVGGTTLGAWIAADPIRGTLEKLNETHYLWTVDSAHLLDIQETLHAAGLLLCYKP